MVASALSAGDDETLRQIKETSSNLLQWREPKKTASRYIDALWIALNTLATIGVVFMNKHTLSDPQLRKSQIMIAAWHFSATFLVLLASTYRKWRLFKAVRLPVLKILPLSGLFAGFLILNNLSLANNSVGFYQLSKILTTPSVVLINFVLFRKYISQDKLLAVSITCVGVGLVSVESVRTNSFGTVVASAAFILTACYQIWIGKKLVDLEVDAPQLLLNQSATAVCLLIPVSYLFDEYPDFSTVPTITSWYLLGGGIVASFLNLSQFMIIGRTSALTFNIVSNIKMLMILALGWYSEGKVFSALDFVGVVLALGGAWQYSRKTQE